MYGLLRHAYPTSGVDAVISDECFVMSDDLRPDRRSDFSVPAEIEQLCMRNLLANTEDKIFFKDRQSRFLLVSKAFLGAQGHGRSLDELIGKSDFDIFSSPTRKPRSRTSSA